MRRLYLHAANEFTLNHIQTGGGFGSHPPPYPPPPLPPANPPSPLAKMLNNFQTVQAMTTKLSDFS